LKTVSTNISSKIVNGNVLSVFVAGCFFLSGAAGLVYEVIWVRLIDKVIGSAPFAVATVLSVFMAGLALGSYLSGRVVDRFTRRRDLLLIYGIMEFGIGICALLVPLLIKAVQPFYQAIYDRLLDHFWCYQIAAFAGCVFILVVPTALMGATLPVLCRYYVLRLTHIGARTGWLYGLNTVGAALGVVLCGFVLIKTLGVWMSLELFAGINGLIGLSCIFLSRVSAGDGNRPKLERAGKTADQPTTIMIRRHGATGSMRAGMLIFAASGFCAMAYEVLWTRLLGLVAGPTTYCFTLVVATFIVGLALGSILFGRLADRTRHALGWLAGTQMAAALMALAVSQLLGNGQFFFAKLIHTFQGEFSHLVLMQSLVLFFMLLGPTLFLGAAFPLVNRLYVQSISAMGRNLGTAYALNTLGALAGSFVAGFVLVPWLGKMNGLRLVILLQFSLAGLALLYPAFRKNRNGRYQLAIVGMIAIGWLLMSHFPNWRTDLLSRGWYRDFDALQADMDRTGWGEALVDGGRRIAGHRQGLEVVFQGEGTGGFTTVEKENTSLGTVEVALFNSGKADASSHGDRSTQTLSAHIPMLFHPGAQKVMLLGLASGMTAGEVLLYPIRQLDILEINSAVATACRRYFSPWNNRCLDDPRSRLIVQDGRNHLALTRESYDVIISEPSNPWMAGLANLYSLEFFQLARRRLTADGIFAQWIQAYEMDGETFSLLGRTFAAVFPVSALLKVGPVDYLMLGFNNDDGGFDWRVANHNAVYAQQSTIITFPGVDFLVHLFLTEDLRHLFGAGRLHTDDRPYLEFSAPMKLYHSNADIDRLIGAHRRLSPENQLFLESHNDYETLLDLVEFAASANVPIFGVLPWSRLEKNQQLRYRRIVADYCGRVLVPSYGIFNDSELKAACADIQIAAISKKISTDEAADAIDYYNLALAHIAGKEKTLAANDLRTAVRRDPNNEPALTALGLLLAETGSLDEAALLLSNAVGLAPRKAEPYKYLGMVELRRSAHARAVTNLSTALALAPDDDVILSELGTAYLLQGNCRKAVAYLTKALGKNPHDHQSR
jgi:spermidine synthase